MSQAWIIKDIEDIGKNRWNNFIEQVPGYTIYNTYEWIKTLQDGEHMPARHSVVEKNNTLIGALPCFISPLHGTPFSRLDSSRPGFGGPLLLHERQETMKKIIKQVRIQLGSRVINHRILSNNLTHLKLNNLLQKNGYNLKINNVNVVFNLTGTWKQVLEKMKKNRRNEIKNADSEEVNELPLSHQNLNRFMDCQNRVLERHQAPKLQPGFYTELAAQLKDRVMMFGVEKDQKLIGGYLLLIDEPRRTARVLIGGIPDIKNYSKHTNSLFKKMFEYTREKNLSLIEFGGAPADLSDGMYRFKESFGGTDYPIYCWETGNFLWDIVKLGSKVLR